ADVAVAGSTLQAMPADDVSLRRHELADAEPGHAFAQPLNFAGEFVPDDEGRLEPSLRPLVPVGDVQVGPANARVAHGDQDPARAGHRLGNDFTVRPGAR